MTTYHALVFEAVEGGFWCQVAELPGCATQGESLDELMANARDAIEVFTNAMREDGDAVPREKYVAT